MTVFYIAATDENCLSCCNRPCSTIYKNIKYSEFHLPVFRYADFDLNQACFYVIDLFYIYKNKQMK